MKFQKFLLLAGLLVTMGLPAMQPLGGQTFDIDYSSGEEEEIESPTTSIVSSKPAPKPTLPLQPYTDKPSLPVTVVAPAAAQQSSGAAAQASPFTTAQGAGIFAAILGRTQQHTEFEVAIANSTNNTYRIEYNNQKLPLAPKQVQEINLPNLPTITLKPEVRTRRAGGTVTTTTTIPTAEIQSIKLIKTSNNQEFLLGITRKTNDKKQIVVATSIAFGKSPVKTEHVIFNRPAPGKKMFYVIQVNLMGNDLKQTTIAITPTLAE